MRDRLTTLPDELLLRCFSQAATAPSELIRLGLISRKGFEIAQDKNLWIPFCEQHAILQLLIHASVGMSALQKGSLNAKQLWVSYHSQNRDKAMKALFSPQQTMLVYLPSYESNACARSHTLLFSSERKFYLSLALAKQAIPNLSSVKCFLQCELLIAQMNFSSLSSGTVSSCQTIGNHIRNIIPNRDDLLVAPQGMMPRAPS